MLFLIVLLIIIVATAIFFRQAQFGKLPSGQRLEKIKHSPNYKNGQFQNIHFTPTIEKGTNVVKVMWEFFFRKPKNTKPNVVLPSKKTDLLHLDESDNLLVWFGHSSYFIQADRKKILVDPVFSGAASPVAFTTRSFNGSDVYTTDDLPSVDYLFITHDHWDHLDYKTVINLRSKVKKVITGLGTAEHLESWGYETARIFEVDWNEELNLDDGFMVYSVPARHFSGRLFKRNTSLWVSFVLRTPSLNLFLGGDSGYDTHFSEIGEKFGPFDLAILECGQYNAYWKYIHILPEEVVEAAIDLNARKVLPVHWAKFSLSLHEWDEPIKRVTAAAAQQDVAVIHPMIGEAVFLQQRQEFLRWWESVPSER